MVAATSSMQHSPYDGRGHDTGSPPTQPRTKWYPLGATAEFMIQNHPAESRWRIIVDGKKEDFYAQNARKIEFGKRYMMKHQVESNGGTKTIYRAKLWEADQPEPKAWDVTGEEDHDVAAGGALLLAHYSDLTFGNVTVKPLAKKLGPQPGDVFREYSLHNGGDDWRVTDSKATAERAQAHLPNPVLPITIDDLKHALRAEVVLDRWGGHAGTKDKQIRLNGNDWISLPELTTTPPGSEPEQFYSQDNPVVPVPLKDLKEGENTVEGGIGPKNAGHWWGQWGMYSVILRVYYDPEAKQHSTGIILSPKAHETLGENPTIKLACDENAQQIDVLAWYDGYDEDGNGVFTEWHETRFQPLRGQPAALRDHVGTIDPASGRELIWETKWVPDQKPKAIKLVAHIHGKDGLIYVTDTVESLSLHREGWSVKQYLPIDVPPHFGVRISETKSCQIQISVSDDLAKATEAVLHYRTWEASDNHHDPFLLNGHKHANEGHDHHYDYDLLPIPVNELRSGKNIFTIHSDTEHHMLEVLWPGPAITVRFQIE